MVKFEHKSIKINAIATALPSNESKHSLCEQTSSDLGYEAALKIINEHNIDINTIGIVLFISKTSDYRGPATALVLHHRLQLPIDCLAFDTPIGACGFETALNIGSALLTTNNTKFALCIFGDTTSKQLSDNDYLQNEIVDGSSAMLLEKLDSDELFKIENLTLSSHWQKYVIPSGGFRTNNLFDNLINKRGCQSKENLHIDFLAIDTELKTKITNIISDKLKENSVKPVVLINSWNRNIALAVKEIGILNNLTCYFIDTNQYAFSASIPLLLEKNFENGTQEIIDVMTISFGEGLSMMISEFKIEKSAIIKTIATNNFFDNGFVTHEM
jgi:3-oxoacyl-[acyl-carrier-protein] synthase-3